MKVYGVNSCASVKKAKKFFDVNNIEYEFVDISKNKVDEEKLNYWLNFTEATSMLNPRSKSYKDKKVKDMKVTAKKASKLMLDDSLIIKRPIIEHGLNGEQKFMIGFKEEDYIKEFLG
jgi:arsenate reductase